MKTNFHTHTYRCQHAQGDVEDYVRAAIDGHLQAIGFSDHTPLPDNRWPEIRMGMDELCGYCQAIQKAKTDFPDMVIRSGLECEYDLGYLGFYRETLIGEKALDFLAGGIHWFPYQGERLSVYNQMETPAHLIAYTDTLAAAMDAKLFAFIAHPDLFAPCYPKWNADAIAASRDILSAAERTGAPLEINTYGYRKAPIDAPDGPRPGYPLVDFWELAAEYDVRVLVNSDAHRPADVADVERGLDLAERCGLTLMQLPALIGSAFSPI